MTILNTCTRCGKTGVNPNRTLCLECTTGKNCGVETEDKDLVVKKALYRLAIYLCQNSSHLATMKT